MLTSVWSLGEIEIPAALAGAILVQSIVLEHFNSTDLGPLLVDAGKLLDLLVSLPRDKLQLFWPDVLRFRQVEYFLPGSVDDHGGNLIA